MFRKDLKIVLYLVNKPNTQFYLLVHQNQKNNRTKKLNLLIIVKAKFKIKTILGPRQNQNLL